jgi:hypothetical protein
MIAGKFGRDLHVGPAFWAPDPQQAAHHARFVILEITVGAMGGGGNASGYAAVPTSSSLRLRR